jgi:hypothetical protein
MSGSRLPPPGPSFVREETVRLRGSGGALGRSLRLGMTAPSVTEDGWWLAHLWAADDDGVVPARAIAPLAGPPPGQPLGVLGPSLAGALSGLLAQEDGRQLVRLRMLPVQAGTHPWDRPLLLITAVAWDPVRASVMRRNELARELLRAFRRAVEIAGSPG